MSKLRSGAVAKGILAGTASIVAVVIVANVAFMFCVHIFWNNVPDVMIQWTPGVWLAIRQSVGFWIIVCLVFLLVFRFTYRRVQS